MDFHDEAVEWFTKHTGWSIQHQFNNEPSDEANVIKRERKTILSFGTCIESAEYRDGVDPLHVAISFGTNVRWCWRTKDLAKARTYFSEQGARAGDIYRGPGNHEYFDLWATEQQIMLTIQGDAGVGES